MRARLPRIVRPALIVLLLQGLALLLYLGVERQRAKSGEPSFRFERLAPGRTAPDLVFVRPDGAARRLSELRGKPVLLHFWATWCPPCREELPALLALGRDVSRAGRLEVVAVSLDEDWATVRSFFGGDIPREVVQDESSHSSRLYDVAALPETYVVDPDGALTVRFAGARDWQSAAARELLDLYGDPR